MYINLNPYNLCLAFGLCDSSKKKFSLWPKSLFLTAQVIGLSEVLKIKKNPMYLILECLDFEEFITFWVDFTNLLVYPSVLVMNF